MIDDDILPAGNNYSHGDAALQKLRILIVADHASARFGGEAALPLHYYRVLRARHISVWLLTHSRVREELQDLFPDDLARRMIQFVEDTRLHRLVWRLGRGLPDRLAYATTGFLLRLMTQWTQRRQARRLVREHNIDVVHQPMPVSPKEPSMLFGLGAPVVIGPMNGGMEYPPAFKHLQPSVVRVAIVVGRAMAWLLNFLMPGKRRAALLLVANARTRLALPKGTATNVRQLSENGVDFSLWCRMTRPARADPKDGLTRFAFLGRLVDWKGVDFLLAAFAQARREAPMSLTIIGDGPEHNRLVELSISLGVSSARPDQEGCVSFAGWMTQTAAAQRLGEHDVLILPSLFECGGAVVLEAMALGLPVIATAWGGPLDYLDAGTGIQISPESVESFQRGLSEAMCRLARDPELRLAMGQRALEQVRREFDWEAKVSVVLAHYMQVARRGKP